MPIRVDSANVASSPVRLRRWRHIRDVAIELFSSRGFSDVSIDDIAEGSGISRRSYFNYFETKAGVLLDPDPEESDQLAEVLRQHTSDAPIWSALTESLVDHLRGQEVVVTARRSILGSDPSLESLHILANAQFKQPILSWLGERGVDGLSADMLTAIALAVTQEAFRHWTPTAGYAAFTKILSEGFEFAASGMSGPARTDWAG